MGIVYSRRFLDVWNPPRPWFKRSFSSSSCSWSRISTTLRFVPRNTMNPSASGKRESTWTGDSISRSRAMNITCTRSSRTPSEERMVETIQWIDNAVVMIDQTKLPLEETYVTCRTYEEVARAIRDMVIRGAPAIGVAAAMGFALGVLHASEQDLDRQVETICATLAATRPTAVNLFWAIGRMKRLYASLRGVAPAETRQR